MVAVSYSDIPVFLHSGAFYRSLSADEPDLAIEVPGDCFTTSTSIENVADFARFLRVANFWMLEELPADFFQYVHVHSFHEWKKEAREILEKSAEADLWEILQDVFYDPGEDWGATIRSGRPDLIKYLATAPPTDCEATKHVAAAGRLDLLTLLRANNHPWDPELYLHAASHADCCMYAHQQGLPWHQGTAEAYSQHSGKPLITYAAANGVKFSSQNITTAASAGNLTALTFLIQSGLSIPEDACTKAAQQGHVECLRALHRHDAEWNWHTLYGAAFYQRIDAVRFLHEHGCVWSHSVTKTAAGSGCLAVLRYAMDHGCPFDGSTVLRRAASACGGSLPCLRYLIDEKRIAMNPDGSVFVKAFSRGDLDCVKYLLDVGCPAVPSSQEMWSEMELHRQSLKHDQKIALCIDHAVSQGWDLRVAGAGLVEYITQRSKSTHNPILCAYEMRTLSSSFK